MAIPWIVQLLIGVGLNILAYALAPRPKPPKPASLDDFKEPTASAGRPIMVISGSLTVTGLNIVGVFDKDRRLRSVSSGGK